MPKKSRGPHLKWRADRKVWEVIAYEHGKRTRVSTGETGRAEAEKALSKFINEQHRPLDGPAEPSARLISSVLADYDRERGQFLKSPRTLDNCVDALMPFWGEKPCSALREETCRLYWDHRKTQWLKLKSERKGGGRTGAEIKASVVARELSVLSAAINHDYKAGRLTLPVPVWKPKFDNRKDVWLSRAEVAQLLWQARKGPKNAEYYRARDYLPLFILLGLYTAARANAVLTLKWNQVDLVRGLIDLHPAGEERTAKGKALIPIPRRLMTFLKYAKKRGTPWGPVIHENQRPFKSLKKTYGEAAGRAGLTDVSPHTLRHTAASWMAQKGVAFPVIARYLGHADSRTTERVYAHHNPDYLNTAREALDNRFNRPITATKKKEQIKPKMKKRVKSKC